MSAEDRPTVDDDDSVSMLEVLAQESRMQEDASAVLGGSDDQECTYTKGYVKRQALYACSTCATTEPAGVCLACCYHCHDGHDLYELYTKRHFQCDCGNSKFKDTRCKLVPTKSDVNEENQYNQNFRGAYCTCAKPYPDPDDEIEDVMIQCVVCEDWYHGRHLGTDVPENDSYQEMICKGCMARHPFLWAYQVSSSVEMVKKEPEGDEKIDVGGGDCQTIKPNPSNMANQQSTLKSENSEPVKEESGVTSGNEASEEDAALRKSQKRKMDFVTSAAEASSSTGSAEVTAAEASSSTGSAENGASASMDFESEEPPTKQVKSEQNGTGSNSSSSEDPCLLQDLQKRKVNVKDCAAFWLEGWREKLCSCSTCLSMYKEQGVSYLLDVADTVSAYEEKGRNNAQPMSDLMQEQSLLSGMSHTQKIEMISGFNDLKTELSQFLKGFADSGKVVSSADIRKFFDHMEKRKKERLTGVQYLCK